MKRKFLALYGDLLIRTVTGLIFLIAGIGKFMAGLPNVGNFFGSLGIPAPVFFAGLVATIEIVAGLMLVLGLVTWLSAGLLAIIITVAIFTAHLSGFSNGILAGWGELRYPLLLLVVLIRYMGTEGFCSALSWGSCKVK